MLGRGRGEVRAMQDLRHLQEVLRFAALLVATVFLPALLLTGLAWSSIQSEELAIDAELRQRATAITKTMARDHEVVFERFEKATKARFDRGASPLDDLGELSPYLRAAFRFDATGHVAAPFLISEDEILPQPTPEWEHATRLGLQAEAGNDYTAAAQHHADAAAVARQPVYAAEAVYARARALWRAGLEREAERAAEDLQFSKLGVLRDSRGHRFADLALYLRSRIRFSRDPTVGATDLTLLIEHLMSGTWEIGNAGEAAIAYHSLDLLAPTADPDWLARTRSQLNARTDQLYWSELVDEDLKSLYIRLEEGEFRYIGAREAAPAVWGLYRRGDLYAFSFSAESLYADLHRAARERNTVDPTLVTALLEPGERPPPSAITSVSLGPQLPIVQVTVAPANPEALVDLKRSKRTRRRAIVAIAALMVIFGVALSARIIGREVDAARMKADFAANVSHELRSPITQIRLRGEALQLELVDTEEELREHYDAIVNEAERLSRLVDNVLDFAAIERGAKRYHLRADDLLAVVWTTAEAIRNAVEQRGLELEIDLPEDLPPLWMDREAIKQVLTNLLSNAAKYGAEGGWVGIKVRLGIDGVDVSVSDRGIGIGPADLEKVFDDFFRSTDAEVRRRKGTGIGLSIVRYIVEAHGGVVSVDSTLGKGTTFTFTLPLDPPDGAGAHL
ncbi:MAG: signal transduction histidine kinase [Myxococcota bacterium]